VKIFIEILYSTQFKMWLIKKRTQEALVKRPLPMKEQRHICTKTSCP